MSNTLGKLAIGSLAEFVWLAAGHQDKALKKYGAAMDRGEQILHGSTSNGQHVREVTSVLQAMADRLPCIKRLNYRESLASFADKMSLLDPEEVIGQLTHASFPFDELWLEGVQPGEVSDNRCRWGFLVTADQAKKEFTFRYVFESDGDPDALPSIDGLKLSEAYMAATAAVSKRDPIHFVQNGKILDSLIIPITVSPQGISFDEDKHSKGLARIASSMQVLLDGENAVSHVTSAWSNIVFLAADFLARIFVVLGSDAFPKDGSLKKTQEELASESQNKSRMRMNRPPVLSTHPIGIDVTKMPKERVEPQTPIEVRQLLGWTSVRRSKEIISKNGVRFTRKPHDRRILAHVDRRRVDYELTARRQDVTLEIQDGRPVTARRDLGAAAAQTQKL